jgi:N utilization substance protein A
MGSRVRNVMAELHGEKIDIVDYSDDPACFVGKALSPARVTAVHVIDADARVAQVIVPDYQLSLAIGKEGQNARLAARLTGWRIDIRSDAQTDGPAAPVAGASGTGASGTGASAAARSGAGASGNGPAEAGAPEARAPEAGVPEAGVPEAGAEHGAADAPAR